MSVLISLSPQCCYVSTHISINPVLLCQYSHLYQPSVAMSVLISLSPQYCYVSTHISINPVLLCLYSYLYHPSVVISVLTSLSTQCCYVSTHIVLIKHPEHQGREFGRVPLREELLVYLDEALQQTDSRLVDQSLSVWRQNVRIVCSGSSRT
jgi:hypothetical protein